MIRIFGLIIPEIWFIIILEGLGAIIFLGVYLLWNKGRFYVYITEKYLDTWKIKKKLRVPLKATSFKWGKDFAYSVDFSYAIIDKRNKPNLFYEVNKAKPIKPLTGINIKEDSKTFRIALDGKIMQHMGSKRLEKWYTIIIMGLIAALIIIGVVALYMMQQNNTQIIDLSNRLLNITRDSGGIIIP